MTRIPLSVVILTKDEASHLEACLASVDGVVDEIFVVDSGSTDATVQIAHSHGAHVIEHEFQGHTAQWRWVLANLPLRNLWVLCLDADQRLTLDLADELRRVFSDGHDDHEVCGFYIARRTIFRGKWIRWGGQYPQYLLKMFRRDAVRFDDPLDRHFGVRGRTARLANDLIEENKKRGAIDTSTLRSSYLRAAGYFIWRYFFRLGFLDGKAGLTFQFLNAFRFRNSRYKKATSATT